jgi:hypothetical protein
MNGLPNATPERQTPARRNVELLDDAVSLPSAIAKRKTDIRRLRMKYRLLCEVQAPIERVFWELEQRKSQLADQLANEGATPFCRPRRSGHKRKEPQGDGRCDSPRTQWVFVT